ncbi:hypothetical protein BDV93DRAFT_557503 [Ceratobasidium sp. AG-I]|nr:hypothetical protein BDV93DRAFT_557503 [Ceratobasidium sp. AG-I]
MVHDKVERNEGSTRTYTTPTTPDIVPTRLDDPAIDLGAFDASTTPKSVHMNPDGTPTHPDASDACSSHRIAYFRDHAPKPLENAGPNPFRLGGADIRRKSTSRDGAFDEGETAYQGVETNRSQQPVDEGTSPQL